MRRSEGAAFSPYAAVNRWFAPRKGNSKGANMRISLIQMNSKERDRDHNVEQACKRIEEAAKDNPDVIETVKQQLPEGMTKDYYILIYPKGFMKVRG